MDFVAILKILSAKPVVVCLALLSALFTALPTLFFKNTSGHLGSRDEEDSPKIGTSLTWLKLANKFGYFLMGVSVFLFIVAGFIVDL